MELGLIEQTNRIFASPGVYIFKNKIGEVLYVGKSTNVRDRLKNHLASIGEKTRTFVAQSSKIEAIPVSSELEALLLEAELIKRHLPRYNARAKDDKHPLYIKITSDECPRVITSRKGEDGGLYFGPFPATRTVKSVLRQIRRIFPFCQQSRIGKRGCMYSHIGLCNPCPSEIERVIVGSEREKLKREYRNNIKNIIRLLSGKHKGLRREMERDMEKVVKEENFEQAAEIRDRLRNLDYITAPYKSPREYLENPNLLEDIRTDELNQLYDLLKPRIKHLRKIKRIECFDVSHTGGDSATSSMVTFVDGEPDKNLYRRFRIRLGKSLDDYAMMKETMKRRLKHLNDWGRSDLMIIDGGKGQLSAVKEVLEEAGVEILFIGLAKRLEEIIIPKGTHEQSGYSIVRLGDGSPALHLLQRIRDEAHRFARKYHFKLRVRALTN